MFSKKIKIKQLQNGWLVSYDNWKWKTIREGEMEDMGGYGLEKAFTYDFDGDKNSTWFDLLRFLSQRYEMKSIGNHGKGIINNLGE